MAITLYGIPNCDQVKKARTWLDGHAIPYRFHDFKKAGITQALIDGWLQHVGWEVLLNRKGTTWRGLPELRKAAVIDAASAAAVMLESPSIVKRPVLQIDGAVHVGFADADYRLFFKK
ncbi:MAG: ArsC family reductase [Burkholderiaceae bacterium]|nr:ArsC family reductase [Burkholderiaceae bacterium]